MVRTSDNNVILRQATEAGGFLTHIPDPVTIILGALYSVIYLLACEYAIFLQSS